MDGVAIVTGGFGVLGRAVVKELSARGWKAAAVDIAPAPEQKIGAMAVGGVDLGDASAVAKAYAGIVKSLGPLSALVNIAGGFVWDPVETGDIDNFDRMYFMNVKTAAVSSRAALGHLGKGGAIVNVGAAAALQPGTGMAPYAASKAGVKALTESLADEAKAKGVRVNAILPTILDTPKNRADMPKADFSQWVKPEAAAKVVAFLVSPDAAAITGASIPLSLGG